MMQEDLAVSTALVPELAQLEGEYEEIEHEIFELTEGLTDEQLCWRPAENRWSIVECLDHLSVAGFELLPRIDRAIADAQRQGWRRSGPLKLRWRGKRFAGWMEPPYRVKVKAPTVFRPRYPESPRKVVGELVDLQGELIKRLYEANGLDLAIPKIASPAASWLKLSLGEWLVATAAHERRHIWQAGRVAEHEAFPRS